MSYAQWNPQANYLQDDIVYDGTTAYQAVVGNTAKQPSLNTPAIWSPLGSGGGSGVSSLNTLTGAVNLVSANLVNIQAGVPGASDITIDVPPQVATLEGINGAVNLVGVGAITITGGAPTAQDITIAAPIVAPGVPSINGQTGAITLQGTGCSVSNPSPNVLSVNVPVPAPTSINTLTGAITLTGTGLATISAPGGNTLSVNVAAPPPGVVSFNGDSGAITLSGTGSATIANPATGVYEVNVPPFPTVVNTLQGGSGTLTLAGAGGLSVSPAVGGVITLTQAPAPAAINKQSWVISSPGAPFVNGSGTKIFDQTFTPTYNGKLCLSASCYITPANNNTYISTMNVYTGSPGSVLSVQIVDVLTANNQNHQTPLSISYSEQVSAGIPIQVQLWMEYNAGVVNEVAYSPVAGFAFLTTD